jgi:hypothetical protein
VKIAGAWVGWGLGDTSEEIRKFKAFMRAKFSYAKTLADTAEEVTFDITKYGKFLWIRYWNFDGTTTIYAKRTAIQLYKPVNYQWIVKQ